MGKDTSELREEIDETRGRMGETVDAIAYKADLPSRARDAITGTVGKLRDRAGEARDRAREMAPDMSDVQERAKSIGGSVRENPIGVLLGAAAIGFLIGSLLPVTELEQERLGPIGDQLREQAKERVQETIGQAREAATEIVTQAISQT